MKPRRVGIALKIRGPLAEGAKKRRVEIGKQTGRGELSMAILFEFADRYARTFIDFWRLRPKRFFAAVPRSPADYFTPYQFLVASLGIVFAMLVAAYGLAQGGIQDAIGQKPTSSAQALAARVTVFLVVNLVLGSLAFRAISRIWPVKGIASFASIFELQCYMMAIVTPVAAVDILLDPILAELVVRDILPVWSLLVQASIGGIVGFAGFLFWNMLGVAQLNNVSTSRLWLGFLFWTVFLSVVGGIVVFAFQFFRLVIQNLGTIQGV